MRGEVDRDPDGTRTRQKQVLLEDPELDVRWLMKVFSRLTKLQRRNIFSPSI